MARHRLNIGWGFLPLLFAATAILTFLVCYIIAVSLDHVIPFVPYVSDTGAYPPESCLFSQFLNLAAALGIIAIYIRYKSLKKLSVENSSRFQCLNTSSFVIGVLSAIGLSIVGNFQWTNQFQVHVLGAVMAFGFGTVYCWMQSYMTYKMYPRYNGLWIARLRVILALVVTLALISMFIAQLLFILLLLNSDPSDSILSGQYVSQDTIDWLDLPISISNNNHTATSYSVSHSNQSTPPGEFLSATIFEWIAGIINMVYFSTFTCEFVKISVRVTVINMSDPSQYIESAAKEQDATEIDDSIVNGCDVLDDSIVNAWM